MNTIRKLFSTALMSLVAFTAVACGGSPSAHAASNQFVDGINGEVYSIAYAREFVATPSTFTIVYRDGSSQAFPDNGGTQFARIKLSPEFAPFVQIGISGKYVNLDAVINVSCSGNTFTVGWINAGAETITDTSCATYNTIKAAAN